MKQILVLGVGPRAHGRPWVPLINGADLGLRYRVGWVWDPDAAVALRCARANACQALRHPTAALRRVDGVMVTTTDPAGYLDLARPFLERGLPVYLNRPMAGSPAMARQILTLARRHGAVVTSGSSLYYSSYVSAVRAHAAQLGRLRAFCATTGGLALYMYLPHAIAVMHSVLGRQVQWVHAFGRWGRARPAGEPLEVLVHVQYSAEAAFGPVQGTLQYLKRARVGGYTLKLWGDKGVTPTVDFGQCPLYGNMLKALDAFFVHRRLPLPRPDQLAAVDIYYAVLRSLRQQQPVALAEVRHLTA